MGESLSIFTGGWFQEARLPSFQEIATDGWWSDSSPPARDEPACLVPALLAMQGGGWLE